MRDAVAESGGPGGLVGAQGSVEVAAGQGRVGQALPGGGQVGVLVDGLGQERLGCGSVALQPQERALGGVLRLGLRERDACGVDESASAVFQTELKF